MRPVDQCLRRLGISASADIHDATASRFRAGRLRTLPVTHRRFGGSLRFGWQVGKQPGEFAASMSPASAARIQAMAARRMNSGAAWSGFVARRTLFMAVPVGKQVRGRPPEPVRVAWPWMPSPTQLQTTVGLSMD